MKLLENNTLTCVRRATLRMLVCVLPIALASCASQRTCKNLQIDQAKAQSVVFFRDSTITSIIDSIVCAVNLDLDAIIINDSVVHKQVHLNAKKACVKSQNTLSKADSSRFLHSNISTNVVKTSQKHTTMDYKSILSELKSLLILFAIVWFILLCIKWRYS